MTTPTLRARALAFYLPQYHPIPENDRFWGPGFTEWTNVAKARPLFRGHRQPNLPGELGFYDLRLPEVRDAQADLARTHGIEGFVYWHYWFAGHEVLQRPLDEVVASGRPDMPFAVAWANDSWTGVWHGEPDRVLLQQTYPGEADDRAHFDRLLPLFSDKRYIRVEGRPLLVVFRPLELPSGWGERWQALAEEHGLDGLHLVGVDGGDEWDPRPAGFDASVATRWDHVHALVHERPAIRLRYVSDRRLPLKWAAPRARFPYADAVQRLRPRAREWRSYPQVVPNWDTTPRSGRDGEVWTGSTPAIWEAHVGAALEALDQRPPEERVLFVKSWNEWAEGNHLEPDRRWGRAYLEALRRALRA